MRTRWVEQGPEGVEERAEGERAPGRRECCERRVVVRREEEDERDVGDGRGPPAARRGEDAPEGVQEVRGAAG